MFKAYLINYETDYKDTVQDEDTGFLVDINNYILYINVEDSNYIFNYRIVLDESGEIIDVDGNGNTHIEDLAVDLALKEFNKLSA